MAKTDIMKQVFAVKEGFAVARIIQASVEGRKTCIARPFLLGS